MAYKASNKYTFNRHNPMLSKVFTTVNLAASPLCAFIISVSHKGFVVTTAIKKTGGVASGKVADVGPRLCVR